MSLDFLGFWERSSIKDIGSRVLSPTDTGKEVCNLTKIQHLLLVIEKQPFEWLLKEANK